MLLNWLNRGGTWQMAGADLETVRARASGIAAASTGSAPQPRGSSETP